MTWAGAITDVYDQVKPLAATDITVYPFEPGHPGWQRPQAITVSIGPLTPTEYGVTIRVYVSTNEDIGEAQTDLTTLVMAVEDRLSAELGRSVWQTVWLADDNAWQCSTVVGVPREDF